MRPWYRYDGLLTEKARSVLPAMGYNTVPHVPIKGVCITKEMPEIPTETDGETIIIDPMPQP